MNAPQNKLAAAFSLHERGDLAAAERQYRTLLRSTPKHPDLLYLLGMLCLDTDRPGMAAGFFDRAIRAAEAQGRTVDPEWRLAHGSALQREGDQESALAAFERALGDDPKSVNGLFCKGTALQELDRLDDAIEAYKTLLDLEPHHAEASYNLGVALRETKKPDIAILAMRKALLLKPDYPEAQRALAFLLEDSGWMEDAIEAFAAAAAMAPDDREITVALSSVLMRTNRVGEAEKVLEPLLRKTPDDAHLISQYSMLRLFQGDREKARQLAESALKINPKFPGAHLSLAMAERSSGDESRIAEAEKLLADDEIQAEGRVSLHFALAGRYGTLKQYEKSLDHYIAGNSTKRTVLADKGVGYDHEAEEKLTDRLIQINGPDVFDGPKGSDSALPVFIVGMPRSGTTLTEQILASHPQIAGAGELSDISNAAKRLRDVQGYPKNRPTETALQRIAEHYLKRLREVDSTALRVTDKMPGNYMQLALIGQVFPNARIVHCRRDPVDNCLSCFMQNFGAEGLNWSFDLGDLAHQYKSYARLMDHWRAVYPGPFLEINYEDTVADLEGQSRRLIDFVGLEWNDSCLDFHKTERAVITASHSQVRQPIYTSSVGRWKRYGEGLKPLTEGLSEFLDKPEPSEA